MLARDVPRVNRTRFYVTTSFGKELLTTHSGKDFITLAAFTWVFLISLIGHYTSFNSSYTHRRIGSTGKKKGCRTSMTTDEMHQREKKETLADPPL
ncbi:hypothetical protein OUZ56_009143 [Daphnia magna]|uniref:Uncharacterized protein n=1 Tax=Daphnia magna TaxID=35525 RepID=A0ABR0AFH9_9CRUS|nr:hypothetical protein OUZ56_009143 [Daphnia magna]